MSRNCFYFPIYYILEIATWACNIGVKRGYTLQSKLIFQVIGFIYALLSLVALALGIGDLLFLESHHEWRAFIITGSVGLFVGGSLVLGLNQSFKQSIPPHVSLLITTMSWFSLCFLAAFPFYLSTETLSFVDSCFEAFSSLTTTGATILPVLERISPTIILWRSVLQWLGGVGIILAVISTLPALQLGAGQLMRSEFSDRSEKILPRFSQIAAAILFWYAGVTIVCYLLFLVCEVNNFSALNHALTVISTGGLSPHTDSFQALNNIGAEMVGVLFMLMGGLPIILQIKVWRGNFKPLFTDEQVRTFFKTLFIATAVIALRLSYTLGWLEGLRHSLFTVTSLLTTAGFDTVDFASFDAPSKVICVALCIIGGGTGSTAGGLKIFRLIVILKACALHLKKIIIPKGVFFPTYNKRPLSEDVISLVFAFTSIYVLCYLSLSFLLGLCGVDLSLAFATSLAMLSNVGPGIHALIGPSSDYSHFTPAVKYLLMLAMVIGRLEFLTFFALFWRIKK